MFSIYILFIVFLLIAVRRVGKITFQIWQIMLLGAIAVLAAGEITVPAALQAINLDVILFLFGMFVVGAAMDLSGYLSHISYKAFRRAGSVDVLILSILFGAGLGSAFLMNDTLAIIGTPVMLALSKRHKLSPKLMLLALAFAVTLGSVPSPIGNPQNLLIAVNGSMVNPFVSFFSYLLIPTVINLLLAYLLLRFFYGKEFHKIPLEHSKDEMSDARLARLSRASLILVGVMILVKISTVYLGGAAFFRLTYIAMAGALPVLAFSPRRMEILKKTDWSTLLFFASMFVLMQSVWDSGFFQGLIEGSHVSISSIPSILLISVLLSQLISNVPLVALYMPMLLHAGGQAKELVALAAGSTVAGNLLILGAASNIIIIQNAEKHGETLSFAEFARVGIPLTLANIAVYWLFLSFL
jgi:Na+/H+ antiporter NhaD/arsenite permease-like protein